MVGVGIGRLSTGQVFNKTRDSILNNQVRFSQSSIRMNTGQRLLKNYDQFNGAKDFTNITGRLAQKEQQVLNYQRAATEYELAETALQNMKNILDTIKTDAIAGGNDTFGPEQLVVLGDQVRNLGEQVYQLANTKLGDKYVFGGLQSDVKVVEFSPGDLFGNAVYKEGQPELGDRYVEGIQASVSLQDIFNINAQSASYQGNVFGVTGANSEINLTVNDGISDYYLGDIAIPAGSNAAAAAGIINAAFVAAGGTGNVVQDGGGFLDFNTNLVTGSVDSAAAAIVVSEGSGLPGTLANLGLQETTAMGVSKDIRQTLGELDSAYFSGDNQRVRNSLADVQANLDRLIDVISEVGNFHGQFLEQVDRDSYNEETLKVDQAEISQLPAAEAAQAVSSQQAILSYTLQYGSQIMQQNIFDFI